MKAYIVSDKDYKTESFDDLHAQVLGYLQSRGFDIEETSIGREDLAFCMGCFGCWIKKPGECVINDMMSQINKNYVNCDVAVYLCPVVFGQASTNIKNAMDRWIPNILPFFKTRNDGSTMHPARYENYPRQIMMAYADDLSDEDMKLFEDIIKKHRRNVDVIRYDNRNEFIKALDQIDLNKVGANL